MRYWIWWNDLIQGPFELDELVSLRAFSEDLLVCMENREDWLPAGRIADLSSAVEQLKIARSRPVMPPPPPPNRPPASAPLQGEFFGEPPGQQSLLKSDDEPKGPYAYRSAGADSESPFPYFSGQATMPFHFSQSPASTLGAGFHSHTAASVLEMPRPQVEKRPFFSRTPAASKESPVRELTPAPEEKIPEKPPVSLKVLQDETPDPLPTFRSAYEDQPAFGKKLELLPWIMGVALALGLLTIGTYWVMDKINNHSAISEANRLEPPVPLSLPSATPLPAPSVDLQDRTVPTVITPLPNPPAPKKSFFSSVGKKARAAIHALKNAFGNRKVRSQAQPVEVPAASSISAAEALAEQQPEPHTSAKTSSGSPWIQKLKSSMSLLRTAAAAATQAVGSHFSHTGTSAAPAVSGTGAAVQVSPPIASRVLGTLREVRAGVSSAKSKASALSHRVQKSLPKKKPARAKTVSHKPSKKAEAAAPVAAPEEEPAPALTPAAETAPPVPEAKPKEVALPGLRNATPEIPPVDVATPAAKLSAPHATDPWAERQADAIKQVMAKKLPNSTITVGAQAKAMLKQMHEKELMHAAETGERLYLPDKMGWTALQEDGARYRVYLNFQAMQANGERVQTRSYQFITDLKTKTIRADDPATEQDLLTQNVELNFKHNPMATDIDSILGGVDTYNKHKVQMIIIKKNRSNREERTKIETALKASQAKIQRAVIYFRRTYPDKALQNVAKAYNFMDVVNAK